MLNIGGHKNRTALNFLISFNINFRLDQRFKISVALRKQSQINYTVRIAERIIY